MSTKTKIGRPRVDSELVRSRLERRELDGLDLAGAQWGTARAETVRRILKDWLETRGYLPSAAEHDGKDD